MFYIKSFIVLAIGLPSISGQDTGVGLGTCTYSFVVQSPYCGKDVGRGAEADIKRLQDSTVQLKTKDAELAAATAALKREIDNMKRENSAMKTAISVLTTHQGGTVTSTPLRVTLIEGHTYIFLGCPNGTANKTVYFMPMTVKPSLIHAISVNGTGPISGIQMAVKPTIPPFPVYCSANLSIVIQRRISPFQLSFNRTWDEYKKGFGDPNGEFWVGLEKIYQITNQPYLNYSLRYEIKSMYDKSSTEWKNFHIGDESEQYNIKNGGDGSYSSYDIKFSNFDKDDYKKCGLINNGFWYKHAFPHGPYECNYNILNSNIPRNANIGPLIFTEITIRPTID